ncbi:carboxymuconolactone decarboxylase family protein [Alkalilimnicola ehrlichii MLHE-1]|uniref:Carboxymuconolactone decarboxylase n=1 Tax=Alkalilimnicola ehrlichii (strain ATCC BAA-1101 / DSM 17681 / MLHE-1) TaxID=187272 RepID=Q0A866_ALKEH|nr:carboxymuconolactone decarboxylase family protein [Alkalilimnicola ehrlichii]ABI56971.1 Carboxymuconolactone decarboxylase [Alkalilimnicola ehrlichii MLHE-1]
MRAPYQMNLPLRTTEDSDPAVAAPLKKARENLGFVPNMYAGMANLPALLETYMTGYERFRAEAGFSPQEQEVIFLTISRGNGCDYCMAAHSVIADSMSGVPTEVTDALRDGEPLPDERLEALRRFTEVMRDTRGRPDTADVNAFLEAGYEEKHILGVILALAVKTLSNYSNHLFGPEVDAAFQSRIWRP